MAHERCVHAVRTESSCARECLHDLPLQYPAGPQQLLQYHHPLAKPHALGVLTSAGRTPAGPRTRARFPHEMNGARVQLASRFPLLSAVCARASAFLGALVFFGGTTMGCGSSCDDIHLVPAGTRFRVLILSENPNSTGCHLYRVVPGDDFELVAGAKVSGGVGGEVCEFTGADGPPIGPQADFIYENCRPEGQLSSQCQARYTACPEEVAHVAFSLNANLPDPSPTVGRFSIHHRAPITCRDFKSCIDTYDVRVERLH